MLSARPEEPSQPVFPAARHHVHMQMRHALTHTIVYSYERSVRVHSLLHSPCQHLRIGEERLNTTGRKICQSLDMRFGDEQAVAGKQRTVVEKGQ